MSTLPQAFRLDRRTIVLTGGAGFLGGVYARVLAQAGARVVVADVNAAAAQALAEEMKREGLGEVLAVATDVSDPASVRAMVHKALKWSGRIDGLVNNAAIDPKFDPHSAQQHQNSFEDFPLDLWSQALNVNVTGLFLCAQAVAPHMLERGHGVIVNIGSIYGMVGPDQRLYESKEPGAPRLFKPVTYSVTKSAVLGLTRYLATYWSGRNIRVNTLTLGGVVADHDPEFVARYSAHTPLGRMAQPSEAAQALLFLLTDASSYMTGANLIVDGGWTAW